MPLSLKNFQQPEVSTGFSDLTSIALFRQHHVQYERADFTLFSRFGCCDSPQEGMSNHCRWNKRKKNQIDTFVLGSSYLSLSAVMDNNLSVECVCLSIAAVQSDQGQAPTEKGPVPKLMSSIIQMESLLSVHCAVVCTLLSQAASPDAPSPFHFDAEFFAYWNACEKNKTPWNYW